MDLISFVLTVIALPLSLATAWWQHRKAAVAERAQLDALAAMPLRIAEQLQDLVASPAPQPVLELPTDAMDGSIRRISYHDINGDGQVELMVEYQVGLHGSGLKLLAWEAVEFREIAELWSDCETGYEAGDFDGDGAIEIRASLSDPRGGELPYAFRPWVRVTYRWMGDGLDVVGWEPEATDEDFERLYREHGRLSDAYASSVDPGGAPWSEMSDS